MDTITKLQAELEELEKRLKAISTAQSTLSHLIAIRDYFDSVQEYLEIIKDECSSNTNECTNCTTQIADLQEQINTINNTIQNLPSTSDPNTQELQNSIATLSISLSNLSNEVSGIKNGSDANLMGITTDISTLQTEIGHIQDQIDEHTTEISEINSQMGDMQNTITNIQSTQNSMTSAHTSMNNSINSLTTRLTTAENNISALTGGVDVSEIDNRITELENLHEEKNPFFYHKETINITPSNNKYYTKEYQIKCSPNMPAQTRFKFCYTSTGSGTLTINVVTNRNKNTKYIIDLAQNPTECEVYNIFTSTKYMQSVAATVVSTSQITIKQMEIFVYACNAGICNIPEEISCHCFNNQIYVTRRVADGIKYGLFEIGDTIDPDNLPNTFNFQQASEQYIWAEYLPYYESDTSTKQITGVVDAIVCETVQNVRKIIPTGTLTSSSPTLIQKEIRNTMYSALVCGTFQRPANVGSQFQNQQVYINVFETNSLSNICNEINFNLGAFVFATTQANNNNTVGGSYITPQLSRSLVLANNGYFYFVEKQHPSKLYKICKGNFAKLYLQEDGSLNAYISTLNTTYKYVITQENAYSDYQITLATTYPDCDRLFELLGNKMLKHRVEANQWWFLDRA